MRVVAQQRHLSVVAGSSLTEKIAVFAPLPSARGTMATGVKAGDFAVVRKAYFRSVIMMHTEDSHLGGLGWRASSLRLLAQASCASGYPLNRLARCLCFLCRC